MQRLSLLRFSFIVLGGACSASVAYAQANPACDASVALQQQCEIALAALRPTQSAVGYLEVEERAAQLKGEKDFLQYTRKKAIPVVQGPDGQFYMTDRHHLSSVLYRLGADKVTAQVIGRLDNPGSFWQDMQAQHWVYLYDARGSAITPDALPARVADLKDDPYRSLAGIAEYKGYYHQTDAYFMQFQWALYFGQKMQWASIDRNSLPAALQTARKLACEPEARQLPGYLDSCNKP
ncbi:MAG: ParB-like protein [Pseudomonadota bacterium]